jgi:hypothetical protein
MLMRLSIVLPANPHGSKEVFVFSQRGYIDFVQKLDPAQPLDEFVQREAILLASLLGFVLFLFEVCFDDGADGPAITVLHGCGFVYGESACLRFIRFFGLVGLLSGLSERSGMEGMSLLNPIDKGSYKERSYQR